ncbi:protein FAM237A-like [Petromyzon marinus]|uniref:Protein FAM237A-like n=1 Tax=Petromyzon marinus TaxID=7757 RepID=A0AAJ7TNG5_PETMA|nr:protein FAM237A-like [Petromyzon marinus]
MPVTVPHCPRLLLLLLPSLLLLLALVPLPCGARVRPGVGAGDTSGARAEPFGSDLLSQLGKLDPRCWELSSLAMRELGGTRVAALRPAPGGGGLWDAMVRLRLSGDPQQASMFWELAQLFWDVYVDCVLSQSHGLGRRRRISDDFTTKQPAVPGAITGALTSKWRQLSKPSRLQRHQRTNAF